MSKKHNFFLNVFIGYDPNESVAYHTCVQSLIDNSTIPLRIVPLKLGHFKNFYKRKKRKIDSTEFSISRFLTPYLSGFQDYSLYMDCDIIINADVLSLLKIIKKDKKSTSLWCVKHNYKASNEKKFLNNDQYIYNKKNWSSFMIFNNKKCKKLTPDFVEKANGLYLHQFKWLKEKDIKEIPKQWNILVGEQKIPKKVCGIHYTLGGPYFKKYKNCEKANIWKKSFSKAIFPLKLKC